QGGLVAIVEPERRAKVDDQFDRAGGQNLLALVGRTKISIPETHNMAVQRRSRPIKSQAHTRLPYELYRRRISAELCPPKPIEFESARSTRASRIVFGT